MDDAILTRNDREEALSRAYVAAVAAGAGYTLAAEDFDRDGVDVQIHAGGAMHPSLGLQLKATARLNRGDDGNFRYPLRRRNYDLLQAPALVPRLLVVLDLPDDEGQWLSVSVDKLVMRRCAYWANLCGLPETDNESSVTVTIGQRNRFDVENLRDLMNQARRGVLS